VRRGGKEKSLGRGTEESEQLNRAFKKRRVIDRTGKGADASIINMIQSELKDLSQEQGDCFESAPLWCGEDVDWSGLMARGSFVWSVGVSNTLYVYLPSVTERKRNA
jgi:hypothetical protein